MGEEQRFRLEPLGRHHDRAEFTCGVESLDSYLKTQASQDMRRKANAVFVLTPLDSSNRIAGYFTLCAYGLAPGTIPDEARKHIPRYPVVSATLIGRLAVSTAFQGQRLGSLLLAEALRKTYENASIVGASMVVVDAINERAVRFYQAHGFIKLPESMRLVLPVRSIAEIASETK
jgi:ribosomal protein S18 acetylase RimI-like enzyme